MTAYHDDEWGRPVVGEHELYERLCLEGFQSGLSWRTVLAKRPAFREVFAGFDPSKVALFGEDDILRLLGDARIIRHRRKIEATINNARAVLALHDSGTLLRDLFWGYAPGPKQARKPKVLSELPASTPEALELSKRLRKLGFAFVGPTTAYAAMQACGIVNDHLTDCPFRADVDKQRREAMATISINQF
jgi:DNA-3-methyladenine glycosylase I